MDWLRSFFGQGPNNQGDPSTNPGNSFTFEERHNNEFYGRHFGNERHNGPPFNDQSSGGFDIMSDPLQIHRYVEEQMNNIFSQFGMHGFDSNGPPGGSFGNFPAILPPGPEEEQSPQGLPQPPDSLRDRYLKPGYSGPVQGYDNKDKVDTDMDGLDMGNWFSFFRGSNPAGPGSSGYFYGQSFNTKTVRLPDGSFETHKTVKDHQGNEEVTITRRLGDKEYTVIKKRDKFGHEEVIEDMINMDENEAARFGRLPQGPGSHLKPPQEQRKWYRRLF